MESSDHNTGIPEKQFFSPFAQQEITQGLFKRFVETSGLALGMADLQGRIMYVNSNFCRLVGIQDPESVYQKDIYILHPPETIKQLKEVVLPFVEKHDQWVGESSVINRRGDIIPTITNVFLLRDDNGTPLCFATTITDISERIRMEKELRAYQDHLEHLVDERTAKLKKSNMELSRLTAILDSTSDLVAMAYPNEQVFFMNAAGRRMLAIGDDESLANYKIADAHPQWAFQIIQEKGLPQAFEHGVWEGENAIISRDGKEIPISQVIMTHHDETGAVTYMSTIMRDISERKQMEIERAKLQEQVLQSQKIEAIGTLAGGIAHDFNNMLGVIVGNTSYALSSMDKSDDLYEILLDIQKSSKQAQNLTHQLLTFSKGGAPIKKVTNLNQLLRESAIFSARGSRSNCRFELSSYLWLSDVDEGQINQVIGNLIINANQAMPNGGTITIQTENTEIDKDSSIPLSAGQYIKINVIDQGIGISKKHLPNIFEPYYTTKQKGSGLGLATAYSIIKRHDGHITVSSELDKGTVFSIYLPASPADIIEIKDKEKNKHTGKGKILIMDDQESILKMTVRILNNMGYEVASATDGVQAIDIYREAYASQNPFKLVILDLTVPGGMGGAKTIIELLKIDPKVKAIVSSGYSNDPIMANYEDYGFCGVVPKPYTKAQLAEVLNKILC